MMYTSDTVEEEADLVFREQSDGRKVCRLDSGKMALVDYRHLDEVLDGQKWRTRLEHRETYAIAYPQRLLEDAPKREERLPLRRFRRGTEIIRAPDQTPETSASPTQIEEPIQEPELVEDGAKEPRERTEDEASPKKHKETLPVDLIQATDRVAIFVDAANLDGACRDAGYWVDHRKVLDFCLGNGTLYGAYYFAADFTQEADSRQRRFLDALNHAGYVIRLKKVKRIVDRETGEEHVKANVDTEVVVEMLNTIENYDVAVLVSGDSDFERLVDILRSRGKRIYVLTSQGNLSRELAYVADQPTFLIDRFHRYLEREETTVTPDAVNA